MTRFSDAVYHRKDKYEFGMTVFTRRDLKVLLLIDGKKTIAEISGILASDVSSLVPHFVRLVQLGLIQTEDGSISAGVDDLILSERPEPLPDLPLPLRYETLGLFLSTWQPSTLPDQ